MLPSGNCNGIASGARLPQNKIVGSRRREEAHETLGVNRLCVSGKAGTLKSHKVPSARLQK